ncbi:RES family NAD+ phosphorylase [Sphingobium sp. AS12]|uniref:RES family NAD+ phosphorylase n=1 Tax=Sphingobium sp. AS12 TaxID=2849495 RepID=UPI001C312BEC|nr:RES family NAD+ phosphorylase [Sphingobium sp. AS12]MBV2150074.1 RES family NAD+ phosphorylase [Sphingobium sp. AS12]
MILWALPLGTTLYRAHTPQWASRPLSGAGAAAKGGRFNREGVEALYLSLDDVTALREYQQTSPFLPPCTMVSYAATLTRLVDLRQLHRGAPWDDLWHDWREDWRHLKFDQHIEPPSWVLGDMVLEAGLPGIVFPSLTHERGVNVVVYTGALGDGNLVEVNDPDGRLPKDRSSWTE